MIYAFLKLSSIDIKTAGEQMELAYNFFFLMRVVLYDSIDVITTHNMHMPFA